MNNMNKLILYTTLVLIPAGVFAQCKVTSELNTDGTISKLTQPEIIFFNENATMLSSVKFDGVDFYFDWIIKPFDKKKVKSESMYIRLDNDTTVALEFYDSYSVEKDSSINMLYRISKKNIEKLTQSDIHEIKVVMDDKQKTYTLKLHKALLRTQLQCIMNAEKKEEKEKGKDKDKK